MLRRYAAGVLVILGLAVLGARAGDNWAETEWTQWSKEQVKVVLHDSPWSKRWSKGQVNTSSALPSVSGAAQEGAAGENAPVIDYYLQLRSAIPVREAFIRDLQIERGYDTLPADQKKSFDDQAAQILNRTYTDVINLHVLYSSNVQAFERSLAEYWQNIRPGAVPEEFFLITERGDRIPPVRFNSPKGGAYEFDLAFPRTVNGEPIIHPTDKTFQIQFRNPAVGTQASKAPTTTQSPSSGGGATARKTTTGPRNSNPLPPAPNPASPTNHAVANFKAERVLVEFNVESMMWKGKLVY
jgi:hypothetical protein